MVERSSAEGVVASTGFARRIWPAESRWLGPIRAELRGWLEPLALTEDDVDDVVLAVNEAASNSSRGRGIVLIRAAHDGRRDRPRRPRHQHDVAAPRPGGACRGHHLAAFVRE
jgi:hypothetical protein